MDSIELDNLLNRLFYQNKYAMDHFDDRSFNFAMEMTRQNCIIANLIVRCIGLIEKKSEEEIQAKCEEINQEMTGNMKKAILGEENEE